MTKSQDLFSTAVQRIGQQYTNLGHSIGWRFLCVSKDVLAGDPKIVFLTLNPGGKSIPADHPTESCEGGSAYLVDQWGTSKPGAHKLQRQVQQLFATIERLASEGESAVRIESSLVGYFVPFRSARFADLHRPKESLTFSHDLWASILRPLSPRLMLAIDPMTFGSMNRLCVAQGGRPVPTETLKTGWGNATSDVNEYKFTGHSCMVVRLPHLSTFQLFSRPECAPYVNAILTRACRHL